ncbi:unnamed protein product [Clavelina lepadiformis]|uniref:Coiled-coil domain-containing protein 93 n=1 Tax=Clavelina lepadiformis TaxID=159417 RepID=A0ABP0FEV8_CLALP
MASSSLFVRGRASSKVGIEYDQEGQKIRVETREDEEQEVRFKEIIDLLIAAGYFRARIKGLSPFDKVVGGMTWCITNCNFDIDVDLLFHENSTIGQKISLTEKIVRVLPKMKCPNRIEPHQIQGLDFKSIFPVIQWLVKKVIETREETGDHIRAYSISQFNKHHKMIQDIKLDEQYYFIREVMSTLQNIYRPIRKYKRDEKSSLVTEEAKVSSTLLEYGRRSATVGKPSMKFKETKGAHENLDIKDELESAFTKVKVNTNENDIDEEENIRLAQEKTLDILMGGMSEMSGREIEGKLATKVVGSIVEMQSGEIQEISNLFAQKKLDMEAMAKTKTTTPAQHHFKRMQALRDRVDVKMELVKESESQFQEILVQHAELTKKLINLKGQKQSMEEKIQEFEEVEQNANKDTLQNLRNLISMNENLKQQEALFKHHCKEESARLNGEKEKLKDESNLQTATDDDNISIINKQWKEDTNKLAKIRLLLAAKSRQAASLTRKIDEVPTRAELTQYQRRFVELYDQIASTHIETKQFYTMYNTLDDSERYLEKEADLLDSIFDNFQTAKSSSSSMQQYLKQFSNIVESVKANKIKVM